MRTIKFRGKNTEVGWVYGSLTITDDNQNIPIGPRPPIKTTYKIWQYEPGDWNLGGWADYEVIPDTVGQFIGLTDSEGVEIWEGDLFMEYGSICSVEYIHDIAAFGLFGSTKKLSSYPIKLNTGKVVGNIFDNPELLK